MAKIRYSGKQGTVAKNELGTWTEGQEREVGEGEGMVPQSAAESLVSTGIFEWVEIPTFTVRKAEEEDL